MSLIEYIKLQRANGFLFTLSVYSFDTGVMFSVIHHDGWDGEKWNINNHIPTTGMQDEQEVIAAIEQYKKEIGYNE